MLLWFGRVLNGRGPLVAFSHKHRRVVKLNRGKCANHGHGRHCMTVHRPNVQFTRANMVPYRPNQYGPPHRKYKSTYHRLKLKSDLFILDHSEEMWLFALLWSSAAAHGCCSTCHCQCQAPAISANNDPRRTSYRLSQTQPAPVSPTNSTGCTFGGTWEDHTVGAMARRTMAPMHSSDTRRPIASDGHAAMGGTMRKNAWAIPYCTLKRN